MKTIGTLLKEARIAKGLSRHELGEMTHIKVTFIEAIETADWGNLPGFNIVVGFVKSISNFLNVDERQMVSILRRDYPPSPKGYGGQVHQPVRKEIGRKLSWGPRLTFFAGIILILFIVLGYLGLQYRKFNAAPYLVFDQPSEGQIVGKTDPDATILVNGQPVVVDSSGNFTAQLEISGSTTQIKIVARSRSGKETTISRTINIKP